MSNSDVEFWWRNKAINAIIYTILALLIQSGPEPPQYMPSLINSYFNVLVHLPYPLAYNELPGLNQRSASESYAFGGGTKRTIISRCLYMAYFLLEIPLLVAK